MEAQLHLITPDETGEWRLDTQTVEVGRRGIALARAALRDARRQQLDTDVAHPTAA